MNKTRMNRTQVHVYHLNHPVPNTLAKFEPDAFNGKLKDNDSWQLSIVMSLSSRRIAKDNQNNNDQNDTSTH